MDYVKVASYIFLTKIREMTGVEPAETSFNDYMVLLNRKLLAEGIDIGLPHYWYRTGDEVLLSAIPYIRLNGEGSGNATVTFDGERPEFDPHDRTSSLADGFADEFIRGRSGSDNRTYAIDEICSHAPFRFQNDFRRLMDALTEPWGYGRADGPQRDVKGSFDSLKASFPSEFGYLSEHFGRFASVFGLALSENVRQEGLFEIAETFWAFFCQHLRLKSGCHHNIPPSVLGTWRGMLPDEEGGYRMFVQNQAAEYCPPDGCGDPVIVNLLKDRDVRLREAESLFMEVFCRDASSGPSVDQSFLYFL